ncbi:MAG: sulfotransferase [Pseudohongiellaceae bacterium]|nr:sulfotransferase [Pseudohongiellaceae bacterium]
MSDAGPDFIVVGAQKSGTTKLYHLLHKHEGVFLPTLRKEINFFNRHYSRGRAWYESLFSSGKIANRTCGEVSPEYMSSREYLDRIALDYPKVKIVILLRNPIERSLSHYKHYIRTRNITESFEDACQKYPEILSWSKYADKLKYINSRFASSSVRVVFFEEFTTKLEDESKALFEFLGLNTAVSFPSGNETNYSFYLPKYPRLYTWTRKLGSVLSRVGLDRLKNRIKPLWISLLGRREAVEIELSAASRASLVSYFQYDIDYVREHYQKDESFWL